MKGPREHLGPLRKVISRAWDEHGVEFETLACGHTIRRKRDMIGPTNADRRRCRFCRDAPKSDGLGAAIDPAADYYVQDSRTHVGNYISWWRPDRSDYCCNLNEAGIYKGTDVIGMRGTDVPWPVEYVRGHTVVHVRGDVGDFHHRERYSPGPRS